MKLQAYDILSQVIPGFIIYGLLQYLFPDIIPKFDTFPSIAIAFLIGYYVNLIASLIEPFYFRLWGGKPSDKILDKDMGKIKLYQRAEILTLLKAETNSEAPSNGELFNIARKVATNSGNERINDFNSSYAAARGILTCVIIISIAAFFKFYDNWAICLLITVTLLFLSNYRAKQRAFYYAREVLDAFWASKQQTIGETEIN